MADFLVLMEAEDRDDLLAVLDASDLTHEDLIKSWRLLEPPFETGDTEPIVFFWHRRWGDCIDCGRPAAFLSSRFRKVDEEQAVDDEARLCSLCAANDAADGEIIRRIKEQA